MDVQTAEPLAPAQPEPIPSTATDQAVAAKDQGAYKAARAAERAGKPLEPVAEAETAEVVAKPVTEPEKPVERTVSKRQQQINEYERTIAALRAENTRLQPKQAAPTPPAVQPRTAATPDPEPDPSDATKYPDGQFDRQYLKDQARWEARSELRDYVASQRQAEHEAARTQHQRQMAESWHGKLAAARTADPEFDAKIDPDTPISEAIMPFLMRQDDGPQLMVYLSAHQDEAARIAALHPVEQVAEFAKMSARLALPSPVEAKPLSSAPRPATTLGRKAVEPSNAIDVAVASGDMTAFKAAKLAQRAAALR